MFLSLSSVRWAGRMAPCFGRCRFPIVYLWIAIVTSHSAYGQSDAPTPSRWALAVHGGAGGDSEGWTEEKKQARQRGMRRAVEAGKRSLAAGGTALDCVEHVVRLLEDDPAFNAGRGSVLTSEDQAELDASIMDGRDRACGAVASIGNVRNPITLARRVMTETRHVLLIGPGAEQFARDQQVDLVDPSYFKSLPDAADSSLYTTRDGSYLGTVGCVALDQEGNIAAATSTGGLKGKMPGRVGDSPIVGAGTFADNATCGVSATGIGEEYIRNAVAYDVSAQMRYADRSLAEAVGEIIHQRLAADTGGLIAVGRDGTVVMDHNTPGMTCGAADSDGRFEVMLKVRPEAEPSESE